MNLRFGLYMRNVIVGRSYKPIVMQVWCNGSLKPCQGLCEGSIPSTCSNFDRECLRRNDKIGMKIPTCKIRSPNLSEKFCHAKSTLVQTERDSIWRNWNKNSSVCRKNQKRTERQQECIVGIVAVLQPSKLTTWVQFPHDAPILRYWCNSSVRVFQTWCVGAAPTCRTNFVMTTCSIPFVI